MNLRNLIFSTLLLVALVSACTKESIKTSLEEKMEAQGWELVKDAKLTPFNEKNVTANAVGDEKAAGGEKGDIEYFVALDEKKVFMRKGIRSASPAMAVPDFNGIPQDFDKKAFEKIMANFNEQPLNKQLIGADNRAPISSIATLKSYPFRTIGSLSGCSSCLGTGCSGAMIGPRHVLTAAHCLYGEDGWYENIYFSPGQLGRDDGITGTPERPNGTPRRAKYYYARSRTSSSWDYGLVILEDEQRTAQLGWFGIHWYNLSSYDDFFANVAGYPLYNNICNASPRIDNRCGGYMYLHQGGRKIEQATDGYLTYDIDTQGGQSGSPVYRILSNGTPVILAVHKGYPNDNINWGSRLRPEVYSDLCDWMGNWPSQFANHPCTD